MSDWVELGAGLKVRQASGDVEVEVYGSVVTAPYGVFDPDIDDAARASLSPVEREAEALRGRQ
jgi:hypothetical protein